MFKSGLKSLTGLHTITKLAYSSKGIYHETGLKYLQTSLNRCIQSHKEMFEKTNKHFHDYTLLKLCQHNNVDIQELSKLDADIYKKLEQYRLPKRVYVGLSSGVDSSFSAALLSQIYPGEVHGIYMQNWGQQQDSSIRDGVKCYEKDIKELQTLLSGGNAINVKNYHIKSFEKEYWTSVFEPFLEEYQKGETPNPDIGCNSQIKFKALVNYIDNVLEKDYVEKDYLLVMGHYCKRMNQQGIFVAEDAGKDQSYYLSMVEPTVFQKVWFPLGHIYKKECREMSKQFDLFNYSKRDSVGICFVENEKNKGNNKISRTKIFTKFLSDYLYDKKGDMISYFHVSELPMEDGQLNSGFKKAILRMESVINHPGMIKVHWIYTHDGLHTYTIGQRVKTTLPQGKGLCGKWYVSGKDLTTNELIVAPGNSQQLLTSIIHFKDILIHDQKALDESTKVGVKLRSLHLRVDDNPKQLVEIDSLNNDNSVTLARPQKGISPGQYLVLYDFATGQVLMGSKIMQFP